jgi:hypothetical protein
MSLNPTLKGAFTITEFSQWSSLSRSGIYRQIRAKKLIKTRIEGRTVITFDNACAWLASYGQQV